MPTVVAKERTGPSPNLLAPEIERLTCAMASGDEEAFRRFHATYYNRLLRYLFVVTRGDEESARDALQDTFARVSRRIRTFKSEEVFWGWLTVLARHAATDAARKRTRYGRMLDCYRLLRRTERETEEVVETLSLEAILESALETLDTFERAMIEGKYFQGASVRDLAGQFQLTEKAVESRLGRARRHLRMELSRRLNHEAQS